MNAMLCKEYRSEEVVDALNSIGDMKAPGPDGMHALFYKKFWDIVGEKVTKEVLAVLNGGPMPPDWNETCIVLIPKTQRSRLYEGSKTDQSMQCGVQAHIQDPC
jgi:hypothetical protein